MLKYSFSDFFYTTGTGSYIFISTLLQEQAVKEKERSKTRDKHRKETKPEKEEEQEKESSPEPAESLKGTLTHLLDHVLQLLCQIYCIIIVATCYRIFCTCRLGERRRHQTNTVCVDSVGGSG